MLQQEALIKYQKQLEAQRKKFIAMAKRIDNLQPVFNQFLPEYAKLINQNFDSKGKIMERERWKEYTKPYFRLKQRKHPGKPMLVISGKLKNAALNFDKKVENKRFIISVNGEPYFYHVSDREKYGRKYFYTKEKDMPIQAWRILIAMVQKYIEDNKIESV